MTTELVLQATYAVIDDDARGQGLGVHSLGAWCSPKRFTTEAVLVPAVRDLELNIPRVAALEIVVERRVADCALDRLPRDWVPRVV